MIARSLARRAFSAPSPSEVLDAHLAEQGLAPGVPGYRRAFRVLADAYLAYAWDRYAREGRICGHCGQVMGRVRHRNDARTTTCSASCARKQMARNYEEAAA
jgi:hypothetical protein